MHNYCKSPKKKIQVASICNSLICKYITFPLFLFITMGASIRYLSLTSFMEANFTLLASNKQKDNNH